MYWYYFIYDLSLFYLIYSYKSFYSSLFLLSPNHYYQLMLLYKTVRYYLSFDLILQLIQTFEMSLYTCFIHQLKLIFQLLLFHLLLAIVSPFLFVLPTIIKFLFFHIPLFFFFTQLLFIFPVQIVQWFHREILITNWFQKCLFFLYLKLHTIFFVNGNYMLHLHLHFLFLQLFPINRLVKFSNG
jgi:hypothetical protein